MNIFLHIVVILGWGLLSFNLLTSPFKLDLKWTSLFVATLALTSYVWQGLLWFYSTCINKDWDWAKGFSQKSGLKKIFPWFLYTIGEDGFCFVPLLYVGDNYFSAFICALIFGALHRCSGFPLWAVIHHVIAFFIVALLILPKSGIVPIVIGHWLFDLFVIHIYPRISGNGSPYKKFYETGVLKEEGTHINSTASPDGIMKMAI